MPKPEGAPLTLMHIGYLHAHLKIPVSQIVAHYPSRLTFAKVHHALGDYYENQKQFDAEIREAREFNRGDVLKDSSMTLPSVGLASIADLEADFQAALDAKPVRTRGSRN